MRSSSLELVKPGDKSATSCGSHGSEYKPAERADESELDRFAREAAQAREEMAIKRMLMTTVNHFNVSIRKPDTGVCGVNGYRPYAIGNTVKLWAANYGLPDNKTLGTAEKFTQDEASSLSLAWCHRCQYFYEIFLAFSDGSFDFQYSQADIDGYEEPECLRILLASPVCRPHVLHWAETNIRTLIPV